MAQMEMPVGTRKAVKMFRPMEKRMTITKFSLAASLVCALALLGACSTTSGTTDSVAAPGGRDCFRSSDVTGYRLTDPSTVRVSVGAGRHYALTVRPNANDLDFSEDIAISASPSNLICTGESLGVEIMAGHAPRGRRFDVTYVARLMTEGS